MGQGLERRPLHSLWLVLQLAVDALEQEKQGLQSQIAQILEGGQQLANLKMSLSLEVATYRYTDAHTALTPCLEGPGTWLCPFCEPQLLLYKNIYFCVFVYIVYAALCRCPQRPEDNIGPPGAGVTGVVSSSTPLR